MTSPALEFTPEELLRLELLNYPNPQGLHPSEAAWRDTARKLVLRIEKMRAILCQHHNADYRPVLGQSCPLCAEDRWMFEQLRPEKL